MIHISINNHWTMKPFEFLHAFFIGVFYDLLIIKIVEKFILEKKHMSGKNIGFSNRSM